MELFRGSLLINNMPPTPTPFPQDGARVMQQAEITVRVDLGRGNATASVYTCDFSYDYVKINADYRS